MRTRSLRASHTRGKKHLQSFKNAHFLSNVVSTSLTCKVFYLSGSLCTLPPTSLQYN